MIQAEDAQSAQLLLRRFTAMGDDDAFRILVSRYADFVYSVCRRELNSAEEAQDVTQEVFVALARKADTLRKDTILHAWLFRVAVNLSRQFRRKEQRRQKVEKQALPISRVEKVIEVDEALAQLPEGDRAVLVLRYVECLSIREVGWEIGLTEDSARMRINRALNKLRRRLGYPANIAPLKMVPASHPISMTKVPRPYKLPRLSIILVGCIVWLVALFWTKPSSSSQVGLNTTPTESAISSRGSSPIGSSTIGDIENQAAQDLLPIYAKVRVVISGEPGFSGETWRSKDVTRWRTTGVGGKLLEAEVKGGAVRSIVDPFQFPEPNVVAIIIAPETRRTVEIDLFEAALIELPRYVHSQRGLKPISAPVDGKSGMTVTGDGGRKYTVWFDSAHRNLIKKVDYEVGQSHFISTVKKWSNVGQGRFVASEVHIKSWFDGKASPDRTVLISDVKTGKDVVIPAMPSPKPGSMVKDEFKQTVYKVDGRWNRISGELKVGNGNIGGK